MTHNLDDKAEKNPVADWQCSDGVLTEGGIDIIVASRCDAPTPLRSGKRRSSRA